MLSEFVGCSQMFPDFVLSKLSKIRKWVAAKLRSTRNWDRNPDENSLQYEPEYDPYLEYPCFGDYAGFDSWFRDQD